MTRTRLQVEVVVYRVEEEMINGEWQEVDNDVTSEEVIAGGVVTEDVETERKLENLADAIWHYGLGLLTTERYRGLLTTGS